MEYVGFPLVAPLAAVPGLLSAVTIAQFKSGPGKVSSPVKIRAHCSGTLEKLTYEGDQWRLLVSVEDSTGSMAVYFSNEASNLPS